MASVPDHAVEAPATGLSLLINWANNQDQWIRALAVEIIETRRPLGESRVAHFFDLLLREKELKSGEPVAVEELSSISSRPTYSPTQTMETLTQPRFQRQMISTRFPSSILSTQGIPAQKPIAVRKAAEAQVILDEEGADDAGQARDVRPKVDHERRQIGQPHFAAELNNVAIDPALGLTKKRLPYEY